MKYELNKDQYSMIFIITGIFIISTLPGNAQVISEYDDMPPSNIFLDPDSLPVYDYTVINAFPHDSNAFTQGLIFENGTLYEGTGLYAQSTLRRVELATGSILKIHHLDNSYFGEGITMWNDTIVQLTWRNYTGFVYLELDTFQPIDSFSYSTEGWGLTHDDTCLIMSDGSSRIYYLDPHSYNEVGYIDVNAEGSPVTNLNELEYIQGNIYANVWFSDSIAIIDPQTGDVIAWLNLAPLSSGQPNVLNGIAYDRNDVRLFITGKLWPMLFEIEVDPLNYPPQIIAFDPPSPCYIDVDSIQLLSALVHDPDPQDSLSYTWSINGEVDTIAHDTCYSYSSSIETIDTVMFKVDDGMFSDSTIWIIVVSDPGIPIEKSNLITNLNAHLSCYPNPFARSIVIDLGIEPWAEVIVHGAKGIELSICDATGRVVKDFSLPTAYSLVPTAIHWDGKDNTGNDIKSGVYFIILDTNGSQTMNKVIFVR